MLGQDFSVNDPTYDYVEDKLPAVISGEKVLTGVKNEIAYHDAGPRTSNKTVSDTDAHMYEADVLCYQPNTSQVWSKDPVYEDPSVSMVRLQLLLKIHATTEVFTHNDSMSSGTDEL